MSTTLERPPVRLIHGDGIMIPNTIDMNREASAALRRLPPEACAPVPFEALAALAWEALGYEPPDKNHATQSAEHVRQSAEFGYYGMACILKAAAGDKHPHLWRVFLQSWLPSSTVDLFASETPIKIPIDYESVVSAGTETAMRLKHMRKDRDWSSEDRRVASAVGGFVVEKCVAKWFKDRWGKLYVGPSNEGEWEVPAADDFSLTIGKSLKRFDVTKPVGYQGTFYRLKNGKRPADFHLLADAVDQHVLLYGWCSAKEFGRGLDVSQAQPMSRLCFQLNCERNGVDYDLVLASGKATPQ